MTGQENTNSDWEYSHFPDSVRKMVRELGDKDGIVRQRARHDFVKLGRKAIDYLAELLDAPQNQLRWEAAKALEQIADPISIPLLINSLEDVDSDVRWIAAEGLIRLQPDSLKPLLNNLINRPNSTLLREGAHHVFREYQGIQMRKVLEPLLRALENAVENVPIIAEEILQKSERGEIQ